MAKIDWTMIGVKPETKKNIVIVCKFLMVTHDELISYMLEALDLMNVKTENKNNPFLDDNYKSKVTADYKKFKLNLKRNTHDHKETPRI